MLGPHDLTVETLYSAWSLSANLLCLFDCQVVKKLCDDQCMFLATLVSRLANIH